MLCMTWSFCNFPLDNTISKFDVIVVVVVVVVIAVIICIIAAAAVVVVGGNVDVYSV